ncbi:hypothetical protein [Actinomadura latina]|uniref:Uncharacterized protein n=1 Tax=Actinomadura latina TaxID=163603 RepID=A0A846ZEK1_9ACTN|nr:hypothetical protein [Actinomadura latina]NKZ09228.1 hypothetical protein [Actinomadura latina]
MLTIMLCGASDTENVRNQFAEIVSDFGGEPLHYLSGGILYLNSLDSSWERNSRVTVHAADLCVFVIIERYGEITFGTELREALAAGKPFIVLCLERTYSKYVTLREYLTDAQAIRNADDRKLLSVMREMELDWQLSFVNFDYANFNNVLRREMANLFHLILAGQQEKNRRSALLRLLSDQSRLSAEDLVVATRIATDELEDKILRKRAISAISANGGADEDTVLTLIGSDEQGVQRLSVQLLDTLYRVRPPEPDFITHCVQTANQADDIGIVRRMIPSLLRIDLALAVESLLSLDLTEVGTRRRIAEHLERHEDEIVAAGLTPNAVALLVRCLGGSDEIGWKARCRELRDRLSSTITP